MILKVDAREIPVRFERTGEVASKHTGRQLTKGMLAFVVRDDDLQEKVTSALAATSAGQPIVLASDDGSQITGYVVESNSYRSQGTGPPWSHEAEVREAESLVPQSLSIDGIDVRPYSYEERLEGDGIFLSCKVEVDQATSERLVAKLRQYQWRGSYFPVIRRGMEEAPRQMRFGQCCWSTHDGTWKYEVFLVEQVADETMRGLPLVAEMTNVVRQVARNATTVKLLSEALVEKGILTSQEMEAIRERISEQEWDAAWDLYRLADIDR